MKKSILTLYTVFVVFLFAGISNATILLEDNFNDYTTGEV